MSDELPTAARVSDPGIRALYRLENRWQAWLDVEAALAKAQAELGIIPKAAAEAIAAAAHYELLDRARLDEGFARTGHTIVPLVWELAPRRRRAAWRLGALGRDDAEHHPDRRPAGAAPGARRLPRADRRRAAGAGRSRRTRRRHADRRAHPRPARGAGDLRLQGRGLDRRADPPCRAASAGGPAPLSSRCSAAAPAPMPRSARWGRRCRPASAGSSASAR